MPPKPSPNTIAGSPRRAAARGHDAGQRRHPADEVRELSDLTDQLQRLQSQSRPSTADHDRIVELVETIAGRWCALRQHYRGPSARPCRAPLFVSSDRTEAAW